MAENRTHSRVAQCGPIHGCGASGRQSVQPAPHAHVALLRVIDSLERASEEQDAEKERDHRTKGRTGIIWRPASGSLETGSALKN